MAVAASPTQDDSAKSIAECDRTVPASRALTPVSSAAAPPSVGLHASFTRRSPQALIADQGMARVSGQDVTGATHQPAARPWGDITCERDRHELVCGGPSHPPRARLGLGGAAFGPIS